MQSNVNQYQPEPNNAAVANQEVVYFRLSNKTLHPTQIACFPRNSHTRM